MNGYQVIEFEQPAGLYYLCKMDAETVIKRSSRMERIINAETMESFGGPQRAISSTRITEIAEFCEDPDAIFPTPIIISVKNGKIENGYFILPNDDLPIGHILDGQHRVKGLKLFKERNPEQFKLKKFDLPVVLMFGLEGPDEGYVFSIINSKQTRVPASLVFDLFGDINGNNPVGICSRMCRALNRDENSPFYKKIKLRGKADDWSGDSASISQGAFVGALLELICQKSDINRIVNVSKIRGAINPVEYSRKHPFFLYYIAGDDGVKVMYKIVSNYFSACKAVFNSEWNNPDSSILSKAIGIEALMMAMGRFISRGVEEKNATEEYFKGKFTVAKKILIKKELSLTSSHFSSSNLDKRKLSDLFVEALQNQEN